MTTPMNKHDLDMIRANMRDIEAMTGQAVPMSSKVVSRLLNEVERLQAEVTDYITTQESMSKTSHWQLERINHLEAEMDKAPALIAELASLRTLLSKAAGALSSIQWGSCDGCGNNGFCPECKESEMDSSGEFDEPPPGKHKDGCVVGQVLSEIRGEESE